MTVTFSHPAGMVSMATEITISDSLFEHTYIHQHPPPIEKQLADGGGVEGGQSKILQMFRVYFSNEPKQCYIPWCFCIIRQERRECLECHSSTQEVAKVSRISPGVIFAWEEDLWYFVLFFGLLTKTILEVNLLNNLQTKGSCKMG